MCVPESSGYIDREAGQKVCEPSHDVCAIMLTERMARTSESSVDVCAIMLT